jgi:hypothetical protein
VDFVKMQDAAYMAEQSLRCAGNAEQAKAGFHRTYDVRLLALIRWLQKRFSDSDLKAAEVEVHGIETARVPPACPMQGEAIIALVNAYEAALRNMESRTGLAVEGK